jgi:hypothetical protein
MELILNILMFVLSACFLSFNVYAQEAPSGCIVKNGKKINVDVNCKCLESKTCLTPKKLEYNAGFFDSVDKSGNSVFSSKEKALFKKTYELTSQLNNLKSIGKGDSSEAKDLYFDLAKVNSELSIELYKNKNIDNKKIQSSYANVVKNKKNKDAKRLKNINSYLSKSQSSLSKAGDSAQAPKDLPPAGNINPVEKNNGSNQTVQKSPLSSEDSSTIQTAKTNDLTNEDKKNILKNLHKQDLEVNEEDSLFEIITKAYKGKAYKRLLEPEPIKENLENKQ